MCVNPKYTYKKYIKLISAAPVAAESEDVVDKNDLNMQKVK
jgi:hypothetical protein